jgi:hypothetical protein
VLYAHSGGVPREIIRLCALSTDFLLLSEETVINLSNAREVIKT